MSEAIERKRAIRSANRGVLTKYMKEAIEHMSGEVDQSKLDRLTTLNKLLNEKLALVIKLDSEILEECDIKDIGKDIEESEEIKSRVYETKNKIEQLFAKKHQAKTSNEYPVSVSTEITTESVIDTRVRKQIQYLCLWPSLYKKPDCQSYPCQGLMVK